MSYDYESTLQLFLHLKSGEALHCVSDWVSVPVIKGISWRLQAIKFESEEETLLYLYVNAGDEVDTQKLSFAIRIDVKPTIFSRTSEFFALHNSEGRDHQENISEGFQITGTRNYDFQKVLKVNKFVVDIKATLTIRSSFDLLAATDITKDISNPNLADFTIQIGSDTWKAHKLILSARSPVFRRMLANKECEESKSSLLKIVDVTKDTFEIFLQFLYSKAVPNLSLDQAMDVLIVADKYDVQELKNLCDKLLVKLLQESDPVHDIFQFAHVYNCSQELKQTAFGFIKKIFRDQNLSDELVEMPEQVKMLVEMMAKIDEKKKEFNETLKKTNEAAKVTKKRKIQE